MANKSSPTVRLSNAGPGTGPSTRGLFRAVEEPAEVATVVSESESGVDTVASGGQQVRKIDELAQARASLLYLERRVGDRPNDPAVYRRIARCHQRLWTLTSDIRELPKVQAAYQKALGFRANADNPAMWYEAAKAYISFGSYEGSLTLIHRIVSDFPAWKNILVAMLTGASLYRKLGHLQHAEAYLMYIMQNGVPPPFTDADILMQLGMTYERLAATFPRKSPSDLKYRKLAQESYYAAMNATAAVAPDPTSWWKSQVHRAPPGAIGAGATTLSIDRSKAWKTFRSSFKTWIHCARVFAQNQEPLLAADCFEEVLRLKNGIITEDEFGLPIVTPKQPPAPPVPPPAPAPAPAASPALRPAASPAAPSPSLAPAASPALGPAASPALGPAASPALAPAASPALAPAASPAVGPSATPPATPPGGSEARPASAGQKPARRLFTPIARPSEEKPGTLRRAKSSSGLIRRSVASPTPNSTPAVASPVYATASPIRPLRRSDTGLPRPTWGSPMAPMTPIRTSTTGGTIAQGSSPSPLAAQLSVAARTSAAEVVSLTARKSFRQSTSSRRLPAGSAASAHELGITAIGGSPAASEASHPIIDGLNHEVEDEAALWLEAAQYGLLAGNQSMLDHAATHVVKKVKNPDKIGAAAMVIIRQASSEETKDVVLRKATMLMAIWLIRYLFVCRRRIRQRKAATRIQKTWRGYATRKHLEQRAQYVQASGVAIQSLYRGWRDRKRVKAIRRVKIPAIITLQCAWRQRLARNSVAFMRDALRRGWRKKVHIALVVLQRWGKMQARSKYYKRAKIAAHTLQCWWRQVHARKVLAMLRYEAAYIEAKLKEAGWQQVGCSVMPRDMVRRLLPPASLRKYESQAMRNWKRKEMRRLAARKDARRAAFKQKTAGITTRPRSAPSGSRPVTFGTLPGSPIRATSTRRSLSPMPVHLARDHSIQELRTAILPPSWKSRQPASTIQRPGTPTWSRPATAAAPPLIFPNATASGLKPLSSSAGNVLAEDLYHGILKSLKTGARTLRSTITSLKRTVPLNATSPALAFLQRSQVADHLAATVTVHRPDASFEDSFVSQTLSLDEFARPESSAFDRSVSSLTRGLQTTLPVATPAPTSAEPTSPVRGAEAAAFQDVPYDPTQPTALVDRPRPPSPPVIIPQCTIANGPAGRNAATKMTQIIQDMLAWYRTDPGHWRVLMHRRLKEFAKSSLVIHPRCDDRNCPFFRQVHQAIGMCRSDAIPAPPLRDVLKYLQVLCSRWGLPVMQSGPVGDPAISDLKYGPPTTISKPLSQFMRDMAARPNLVKQHRAGVMRLLHNELKIRKWAETGMVLEFMVVTPVLVPGPSVFLEVLSATADGGGDPADAAALAVKCLEWARQCGIRNLDEAMFTKAFIAVGHGGSLADVLEVMGQLKRADMRGTDTMWKAVTQVCRRLPQSVRPHAFDALIQAGVPLDVTWAATTHDLDAPLPAGYTGLAF